MKQYTASVNVKQINIVGTEIIRGEGQCMYQNMDWIILEACLKVKEPGFQPTDQHFLLYSLPIDHTTIA